MEQNLPNECEVCHGNGVIEHEPGDQTSWTRCKACRGTGLCAMRGTLGDWRAATEALAPDVGKTRDAVQWAMDCGMAYSTIGGVITVDRFSLDRLVSRHDAIETLLRRWISATNCSEAELLRIEADTVEFLKTNDKLRHGGDNEQ